MQQSNYTEYTRGRERERFHAANDDSNVLSRNFDSSYRTFEHEHTDIDSVQDAHTYVNPYDTYIHTHVF